MVGAAKKNEVAALDSAALDSGLLANNETALNNITEMPFENTASNESNIQLFRFEHLKSQNESHLQRLCRVNMQQSQTSPKLGLKW